MPHPKPVVLCILDGWGLREGREANAPALAETPTYDRIMATCPHATLVTFGPEVGLPEGQMGNSEVGHTNIGAGRVVLMDLLHIDKVVADDALAGQVALARFIDTLQGTGGTAHLMGLVSEGGVHSQMDHLIAAARAIRAAGVPVAIHAFTDGRDVPPTSAAGYVDALAQALPEVPVATVSGRYFAMDRDNRWARVEKAYRAMVDGEGIHRADNAAKAVAAAYGRDQTDEFIEPTVIGDYAGMRPQDGIFMLNFRADRAREILAAIGAPDFEGFDRGKRPELAARLGMVDYSSNHDRYMTTVFPKQKIVNTIGEWVAAKGLRQFRLAETEKYPHVTFFLNGGREDVFAGEDRTMPRSPDVATYDLQPEMSAPEVTEALVEAIGAGYDLIVVNYANPDMVGHTGDIDAAIRACEAVDQGLGRALEALEAAGGALVMIADHGNCETMVDPETGAPHTAHTTNLVPVAVWGAPEGARLRDGRLADVAPTVLALMGLDQPPEMTGRSLIEA